MRGTLYVSSNLGLPAGGAPGAFVVRALVKPDWEGPARVRLGQQRADVVARAFEDALNAPNRDVVQAYVQQSSSGTLTVLTAARILDRAGVRP